MAYDQIQAAIDLGKGFAAQELGVPHNVYRITNASTGNVIDPSNMIASAALMFTKIAYGGGLKQALETERQQGIIWYELVGDMSPWLVGDVFVVNDPIYGSGYNSTIFGSNEFKGFAVADRSPIKKALGGRLNLQVQIYRLSEAPNTSGQWARTSTSGALPLMLTNGVFSLGTLGQTASFIPAGLMATGKSYGDKEFIEVPAEQRKSGWECYLPALNGFQVREGDRIITQDGARYIVIVPYTQAVGACGSQWFLEREDSQAG